MDSESSVLIMGPKNKKGQRVVLKNLDSECLLDRL